MFDKSESKSDYDKYSKALINKFKNYPAILKKSPEILTGTQEFFVPSTRKTAQPASSSSQEVSPKISDLLLDMGDWNTSKRAKNNKILVSTACKRPRISTDKGVQFSNTLELESENLRLKNELAALRIPGSKAIGVENTELRQEVADLRRKNTELVKELDTEQAKKKVACGYFRVQIC